MDKVKSWIEEMQYSEKNCFSFSETLEHFPAQNPNNMKRSLTYNFK